ncbi:MAG: phosphoenolpyruvate carboxykinase (GTP) [bacterium]
MSSKYEDLLKSKMSDESYRKLYALDNEKLFNFVGEYIELCEPDTVYMCDDSEEDAEYIRNKTLEKGEEARLAKKGQTIHYDGYYDQARDKDNTKFLVPKEERERMGKLNCVDYDEGLAEIKEIARGIMKGKEAIVKLFCECPTMSLFSIACAQITDSYYVSHSEDILYRRGYEHFMKMEEKDNFFRFVHSAGALDAKGCTINLDKRRIYQDVYDKIVYSMNDQYAGNSLGLKKHSMRLAIKKSGEEGWLCEHMFIMSCQNERKNRTTYFVGAYPSACGKTATAMIPGEKLIGDDIAYFKKINGEFRAANVERGIFGIIKDVNGTDDPVIFRTLMREEEMIFSNVLTGPDNNPYWSGMGIETPTEGKNHSGRWQLGKKDENGKVIPISHDNSRYTIRMEYLENLDPAWNDKNGVPVGGVLYGGRDSDTCVPIEESLGWDDGIIMKACTLESETTAATIGMEGVRKPQPMANLDFISYPIGRYIQNNLDFIKGVEREPRIFATNYFLKTRGGNFCNSKLAKKVWLHWADMRIHKELDAYKTPTGLIPKYEDLAPLFTSLLNEEYSEEEYRYQFSFRCNAWLAKLERSMKYFKENIPDCPSKVYETWENAKANILAAKAQFGALIEPGKYTD